VNTEQRVEAYARERMARGEVLTWRYDRTHHTVTLYVPDDVDLCTFPEHIAGVPTAVKPRPRPITGTGPPQ
jgi:hypothetical protein